MGFSPQIPSRNNRLAGEVGCGRGWEEMSGSTTGAFGWMGLLNPALRYEFSVLKRHKRYGRWTKSLHNRNQREACLATEPLCVHVSNLSRQVVRRHHRGSTRKGKQGARPAA